ncbi:MULTISPECIES: DUF4245 domain-containing protein [unclassified Mycobacterium]|uniref:DUF4245 domain-containing protein n=1 Tax=unclassified Mycobacterium TaxID=2642494 RepID=UPI0029C888AE|nr:MULTISPECIES: DUF4245 domain-containing protein [unclassified Mycobacterium]
MTVPPQPTQGREHTEQVVPVPRAAKSRLLQDGRDMFWSMAPLVVACVVLAGMLGMCSFAPSGPGQGPAPQYDAPAALQADADALKFPIRVPKLPDGWHANSGGRGSIEGGRTDAAGQPARAVMTRVGYLAPTGMFLGLTQSNADEEKLVQSLDTSLVPTGARDVDGVRWIVYEGGDPAGEHRYPVWTTRLPAAVGQAQIAITGAAGTDEYRTLAAATQTQPPLPVR